jgi:hypothetical protein
MKRLLFEFISLKKRVKVNISSSSHKQRSVIALFSLGPRLFLCQR